MDIHPQAELEQLLTHLDDFALHQTKAEILYVLTEQHPQLWAKVLQHHDAFSSLQPLPLRTSWTSEALLNGTMLCMAVVGDWGHEEVRAMGYAASEQMNNSKVYGIMLRMLSGKMIVKGAASRWGKLHQGTTLHARDDGDVVVAELQHPPHLFGPTMAVAYEGVFQAILDVARDPGTVHLQSSTPTMTTWTMHFR